MGKKLLMLLVAVFMTALTASAQDNSYSMVIEMANGTKINIGPNDIKNLSFIDGKLTLQGESIEDMKNDILKLKSAVDNIQLPDMSGVYSEINALKMQIAALNAQTSTLQAIMADYKAQIDYLNSEMSKMKEQIENNNNNNPGDGNYLAKLAGTWVQNYNDRGYIGIKFTADGKAYYNEWDKSEQPNFDNVKSPASVTVTATTLRITHPMVSGYYEEYSYQLSSDGNSVTFSLIDYAKDKHSLNGTFTKLKD